MAHTQYFVAVRLLIIYFLLDFVTEEIIHVGKKKKRIRRHERYLIKREDQNLSHKIQQSSGKFKHVQS